MESRSRVSSPVAKNEQWSWSSCGPCRSNQNTLVSLTKALDLWDGIVSVLSAQLYLCLVSYISHKNSFGSYIMRCARIFPRSKWLKPCNHQGRIETTYYRHWLCGNVFMLILDDKQNSSLIIERYRQTHHQLSNDTVLPLRAKNFFQPGLPLVYYFESSHCRQTDPSHIAV